MTVSRKNRDKIPNIVCISDTHVGCALALVHIDGAETDDGGTYMPSPLQKKIWQHWEEFWGDVVPRWVGDEPYWVVMNGDVVDGVHHGSTTQWSHNMEDQINHAYKLLKPIVDQCEGRYYHIRGTQAHIGQSGVYEEQLAKRLGAIPNEFGQYARWDLWKRLEGVNGGLCHFLHHIGTTSSSAHETSAINAEIAAMYADAGRFGDEPPKVVCRSHRHQSAEIRLPIIGGYASCFVTPAWQLKCLALDTLLPTPRGWTMMSSVQCGDVLFDENGAQCYVTAVSSIQSKAAFEVIFSNGERVVASDDHLWLTTAVVDKPGVPGSRYDVRPLTRVRTTRELFESLRYGKRQCSNHRLLMPQPLDIQDQDLPIDPYVLGCWLGDGDSDSARLIGTADDVSFYAEEFAKCGYAVTEQVVGEGKTPRFSMRATVDGIAVAKKNPANLQAVLRKLGLLGSKHIPAIYLRGSAAQRLALLQGLMDTDGQTDGRSLCGLSTTSCQIRDGLAELLASLGIKYSVKERPEKLNGRVVGAFWFIQFFISPDVMPVFRLPRKLNAVPSAKSRRTAQKSRSVQIVDIKPREATLMKCIAVDSPSSLYRFGRTMLYTHNTPYAWKIAGARVRQPQLGGSLIRLGDEELHTRHHVVRMERSKEE